MSSCRNNTKGLTAMLSIWRWLTYSQGVCSSAYIQHWGPLSHVAVLLAGCSPWGAGHQLGSTAWNFGGAHCSQLVVVWGHSGVFFFFLQKGHILKRGYRQDWNCIQPGSGRLQYLFLWHRYTLCFISSRLWMRLVNCRLRIRKMCCGWVSRAQS